MMVLTQIPKSDNKTSVESLPLLLFPPFPILVPPRRDDFRFDNHRNIIVKVALLPPHSPV